MNEKIDLLKNNPSQELKINKHSYIYLIEKYDLNHNIYIYKFGKSTRPIYKRLKDHGNEAKILLTMEVNNCHIIEKKILNILRNDINIICRDDIGREYFCCDNKKYIKHLVFNNLYNNYKE
jgi:hypothetical protein